MEPNITCTTFNLSSNALTSLDEDLFMTHYCINSTILLSGYAITISITSTFLAVHLGLIMYKIRNCPEFKSQNGFFLVLVEMLSMSFLLIGYTILLLGTSTWLSVLMIAISWQFAVLWVDLLVYAM